MADWITESIEELIADVNLHSSIFNLNFSLCIEQSGQFVDGDRVRVRWLHSLDAFTIRRGAAYSLEAGSAVGTTDDHFVAATASVLARSARRFTLSSH